MCSRVYDSVYALVVEAQIPSTKSKIRLLGQVSYYWVFHQEFLRMYLTWILPVCGIGLVWFIVTSKIHTLSQNVYWYLFLMRIKVVLCEFLTEFIMLHDWIYNYLIGPVVASGTAKREVQGLIPGSGKILLSFSIRNFSVLVKCGCTIRYTSAWPLGDYRRDVMLCMLYVKGYK